ncbi:MAG: family 20 glycosylhydrolase [Phycisphaerae bacterium]|nr:family 20 glycosylhydrolase [Phycisphaerae bacterium]
MSEPRPLLVPAPRWLRSDHGVFAPPAAGRRLVVRGAPPGSLVPFRSLLAEDASAEPSVRCAIDSPADPRTTAGQSYRLHVAPGALTLTGRSEAALRAGLATLAQLLRQYGPRIPCLRIEDEPVLPVRGVMLDVSRDRIPTQEELFRVVETLATLKINHLQLYTEHTFAYAAHEEVWRGWSPLTADEMQRLDRHSATLGIELAANQNCFGHLAGWLRHPRYAPLAEMGPDEPWRFYHWTRTGPFSICPTDPRSLALIRELLLELLPCFSSSLVNIGCDETADVGQGRSRDEVARRGAPAVYFDFLANIDTVVRAVGKRSLFWADIALSHPESVNLIPEHAVALAWDYEPDARFARWAEVLGGAGRAFWICPGTSSWRSITGRSSERSGNIGAAIRAARAGGAAGMLICDWGDVGHQQQWPISLHGIAQGAQAAWAGSEAIDLEAESLHVFDDPSRRIGRWLDDLGNADAPLRAIAGPLAYDGAPPVLRNASAIFADLHTPLRDKLDVGAPERWASVGHVLQSLAASLPGTGSSLLQDECTHAAAMAQWATRRALLRRSPGGIAADDAAALRRQLLDELVPTFRRLWLARSRVGGLDHSCAHLRRVASELCV